MDLKSAEGGGCIYWRRWISTIALLLSVMGASCLVFYQSASPFHFLPTSLYSTTPFTLISPYNFSASPPDNKLEKILREAAMEEKTVVITTLNNAWAEPNSIFDIFLESFRIGNETNRFLKHLVVVAFDEKAYARCMALHPYCYALTTTKGVDFSGEAYFMTADYLEMMWTRIEFLLTVLHMGYNFIFTDADIMWFRDPFPHFYRDTDFQIACDNFNGRSLDRNNNPNGGFNYVKSNKRTIDFYWFWNASRETYPGLHDQDVLNKIKYDPFIKKIGLKLRFLNTVYFGGFCEPSKDFNVVCTMHANCCVGLDRKVHDLTIMLQDWRNYMALPKNEMTSTRSSWSVPQNCSLSSFRPPEKKDQQGSSH